MRREDGGGEPPAVFRASFKPSLVCLAVAAHGVGEGKRGMFPARFKKKCPMTRPECCKQTVMIHRTDCWTVAM